MKIPNSLRLSLREMFLLVAFAGVGLGWYREHCIAAPIRDAILRVQATEAAVAAKNIPRAGVGCPLGLGMAHGYGCEQGIHFIVTAATQGYWEAHPEYGALPEIDDDL